MAMQNPESTRTPRGFTLVELIVGILLSAVLVTGTYMIFSSQQTGLVMIDSQANRIQAARRSVDNITRMVRQAGLNVVSGQVITEAYPQRIAFRGDVDTDIDRALAEAVNAGDMQIKVDLNDALHQVDETDFILLRVGKTQEMVPVRRIGGAPVSFVGEPDTIYLSEPVSNNYPVAKSTVHTIENVDLAFDAVRKCLLKNGEVLADRISNLQFVYYDNTGAELVPADETGLTYAQRREIRKIDIITNIESASDKGTNKRHEMTVDPRNIDRPSLQNDTTPPAAPTNLMILDNGTCGHFVIAWSAPNVDANGSVLTDLAGYKVYFSPVNSPDFYRPGYPVVNEMATEIQVSDLRLQNGESYRVTMTAYDTSFNESPFAGEIEFTLNDRTGPPEPIVIEAISNEDGTTLTWRGPADTKDIAGYRIYRGTGAGSIPSTPLVDETALDHEDFEYSDKDIDSCRTYYYTIAAVDCANVGTPTDLIFGDADGRLTDLPHPGVTDTTPPEMPPAPPAAPTGASAASADQKILLSWVNPPDTDFESVVIRFATDNYPIGPDDGELVSIVKDSAGMPSNYEHAGLENGRAYFYSIFALDRCGNYSFPTLLTASPAAGIPMALRIKPIECTPPKTKADRPIFVTGQGEKQWI